VIGFVTLDPEEARQVEDQLAGQATQPAATH
jgi:hypothetical protein